MRVLQVLALGAQLVAAISFSDPVENATLTRGATFDLSWSSVDTDPTDFSVYLVNFVNWPPYYAPVDVVETAAGQASVRVPCDVVDSYGYQFNAINGTNVYVIYAQTPKFSITGDSCTDPVPTTATGATCAAQATVTVTVRGNSSTSTSGPGAPTITAPVVLVGSNSSVTTATNEGACPSTIGWSGDYNSPVTLSETPHAGRGVATTMNIPTPTGASASATVTAASGLTGNVKAKGCSKKRQSRKRHSDGNGKAKTFYKRR